MEADPSISEGEAINMVMEEEGKNATKRDAIRDLSGMNERLEKGTREPSYYSKPKSRGDDMGSYDNIVRDEVRKKKKP